jgi:nitrite reductase/ring-hydroxylating ferredoxin subunit
MPWTSLCTVDEITESIGKFVDIGGFELAVFVSGGEYFAIDNRCPHAGANLAGGAVANGCVTCPRHAWTFELATGELAGSPGVCVKRYPVRLHQRPGLADLVQADLPIY